MAGMDAAKSKEEKMKIIFDKFDINKDLHLGITELLGWIMAVEPTLSNDLQRLPFFLQICLGSPSFRAGSKGLSYYGFTHIYEEGHRNLDHDFNTINIQPLIHQYQQQQQQRSLMLQSQLLQQQAQQYASLATTTYSNNSTFSNNNLINNIHYRNTTQQVSGEISSAGQVYNIGITAQQMGGGISSAAQVNSYGNTMQQVGGEFNSAAQVNNNVNSAKQENAVKDGKSKVKYNGSHPELATRLQKEILDTNPGVKWVDVAGLSEAKGILWEIVVLPLLMPERPWIGVLMFGPPVTGKTLLAKAVATECGTTYMNISCSLLCGKWYGESERLTQCLFELTCAHASTIIFIDEIDSLCSAKALKLFLRSATEHETSRRLKSELLVQIDGLNNSNSTSGKMVTLLAATISLGQIYIPLPDFKNRKELIRINLKSIEVSFHFSSRVDIEQVAQKTEGNSGDDLTNISRDASLNGMRRKVAGKTIDEIKNILKSEMLKISDTMEDFLEVVDKIKPTVSSGTFNDMRSGIQSLDHHRKIK
ncbi:hypothetical protein R3W88_029440 [Solanum pinnatisectum]|uniref:EF-hand domain-containing protein n=1 Tax=Solanum pinnatisectum TaxID=50273 RepID=A0AAV9K7I3_9SOLN|nr:hypothetical protein R3W88_029440 [Solanum pinnatisectum]